MLTSYLQHKSDDVVNENNVVRDESGKAIAFDREGNPFEVKGLPESENSLADLENKVQQEQLSEEEKKEEILNENTNYQFRESQMIEKEKKDGERDEEHYDYIYQTSGLPVIAERKFFFWGKFNKYYYYPNHEHAIIWGGSGSGKTQSLVYPLLQSIMDAKENAIIHDCKLELFEAFGKKFKNAGYNVIVLNFANPRFSHRWNPFHYPTRLWRETLEKHGLKPYEFRKCRNDLSRAIEVYKDCAMNLCYEEDNDRNSYFWKGAGNMMAGACLLLAEEGRFDCINGQGVQMIYAMDRKATDKGKLLESFLITNREISDDSVLQINNYLTADVMTRGNIESTFRQKVEILNSTPDIRFITSGSDFELEDIFEKQTVVFVLTQDEKDQYYPLVTLFLKQLYEVGVQLTRQGRYKEWPYKMNWVLEEMGILPEIKNFKNIYNAARSRGLTIYGFMQSMADAIDKYEITGTHTIMENCRVQVVVHGEQDDTIKYITDRCGKELYWDRHEKRYKERDLMTKSRLNMFEKGRIIFTIAGQRPYIAKLPQYKQTVFYQEPDLGFIRSDEMFGANGRSYNDADIHWFKELPYLINRQGLANKFEVVQ